MRTSGSTPAKAGGGKPIDRSSRRAREIIIAVLWGSCATVAAPSAGAQGLATAAVRGTLVSDDPGALDGARVRVVNSATGVESHTVARGGRFLIQGLEVGGPYFIEVRQIGFAPQRSEPLFLSLGEPRSISFTMQRVSVLADAVVATGAARDASLAAGGGTATLIPESLVHRLPTLNRNFYDFIILAPQLSTKVGFQRSGVSGAGANQRFNNFLINGADERFVNGNVSAAANGRKSIPMDAVKEFQVLVAPYDVRYGDFAGALVNTVTQSGTNELNGSASAYWRNDRLARRGDLARADPYDRAQYGFTVGGPIVRDRAHFFIASEIQRLSSPAPGPYLGQPSGTVPAVPVSAADLARFEEIMRAHGLVSGSGGQVTVRSPLQNLFARVDVAAPRWASRAIAFVNHASSEDDQFSRVVADPVFHLSTYRYAMASALRLASLQVHTDLPRTRGGHNELQVSHLADRVEQLADVKQPLVRVVVPGTAGDRIMLHAGTAEPAQGRSARSRSLSVKNELSLPLGSRHLLLVGAQAERYRIQRRGVSGGYGVWTFASLDDLERRVAERYQLRSHVAAGDAPLLGGQYAAYVGDEWRPGNGIVLTTGLRADVTTLDSRAPYNRTVDSIFARRTDEMPRSRVHLSPRVGFSWDPSGGSGGRLRGGVGLFTGRAPRAWLAPAITSYGMGIGELVCGTRPNEDVPPPFEPDYRAAPTACATGPTLRARPNGDVDLLDRNLRMAQSLRASLAYDRRLPWDIVATTEALLTRYVSDFVFVNLNLAGPQAVDRFGRVLYGSLSAGGVATPATRSAFSEVIDLTNTSRNYSYHLSARLERRFARGFAAVASYTHSRTRDVQSPSRVNVPGRMLWADARAVSGRHEELKRGISLNDLPHRIVGGLSYTSARRWPTTLSVYYVGESGSPFTYVAGGVGRRGDLNADGSNANDPIYVPRDATDPEEIFFSGGSDSAGADSSPAAEAQRVLAQQTAFEKFIAATPCLRRQRGAILERNSCREPWSHTTIASVRQAVPVGGQAVEAELDVFNVLNLLNGAWGKYRVAAPRLLDHVGQTAGPPEGAQPVFRFDTTRKQWTTLRPESAFQIQLALRYRF